jgi:hypothetical protein
MDDRPVYNKVRTLENCPAALCPAAPPTKVVNKLSFSLAKWILPFKVSCK